MNPNQNMVDALVSFLTNAESKGDKQKAQNYKRAIGSMQKYPMPLSTPQEATSLVGIGDTIARELDNYLNPNVIVNKPKKATKKSGKKRDSSETNVTQGKPAKKKRKYSPKYRTAPWALLVGHYRSTQGKSTLSKDELISVSQSLSEAKLKPQFVVRLIFYNF
jgi:crossover junction endonuclease MUS81